MHSKLILLVEDSPDDVALTLSAFKRAHVDNEVAVALDGVEALDYVFGTGEYVGRDTSHTPAMILLDVDLPRLRGTEVLRRLRADPRTALIPTVMLTTSREERDIEECYRYGANSYVRKPVDFQEFVGLLHDLTHYWLVHNEGMLSDSAGR
ncbi:MAG: response regulator [Luteolibacter sp.]